MVLQRGGARDLRVTSPAASSCCGSCCDVHQAAAPLQGPRSVSSCCSAPTCGHRHHHHHHAGRHHHLHHHHQQQQHRRPAHHHHRRPRGSRQAATSASSCSSGSSPPSSPPLPASLCRYPLPPQPSTSQLDVPPVAPGHAVTASPFELRRLPVNLRPFLYRYFVHDNSCQSCDFLKHEECSVELVERYNEFIGSYCYCG